MVAAAAIVVKSAVMIERMPRALEDSQTVSP
jgi:hypothetical protein